jgi:hypothetical protein
MKIAVFWAVVLFSIIERYQELAACSLKVESAGSFKISVPFYYDRLCGLVVRVLGYRSGGLGSIQGITKKKK